MDFLNLMSHIASDSELQAYYEAFLLVSLERQVGNRYFVTAANATKIFFLKNAAVEFILYTGKDKGNKLERSVYEKLTCASTVSQLKIDGIMFYHVYADLVMLSKSVVLDKSVTQMNSHYLELSFFLQVQKDPAVVLNKDHRVFLSEPRFHSDDNRINFRIRKKSQCVFDHLFSSNAANGDTNDEMLHQFSCGAGQMREKLHGYASTQLPGGKYWDPEPNVKKELDKLKPSNDLCEAILGLNDYLTTAIPNLHQASRSNLVQVKKNKTIQWLEDLPKIQQSEIIDLAVNSRKKVKLSFETERENQASKRRERMVKAHTKHVAAKAKRKFEKEKLLQIHFISTTEELDEALHNIDDQFGTPSKRKKEKIKLLKDQVNYRKKVLDQNIHVTFTHSGRQRNIDEIITNFKEYIRTNPCEHSPYLTNPSLLVGRQISHRFELPNYTIKWYRGRVLAFNETTEEHTIIYENEPCNYNLICDILNEDLIINS